MGDGWIIALAGCFDEKEGDRHCERFFPTSGTARAPRANKYTWKNVKLLPTFDFALDGR